MTQEAGVMSYVNKHLNKETYIRFSNIDLSLYNLLITKKLIRAIAHPSYILFLN